MIPWYAFKHFWWGWGYEISLDEETIKLIWPILWAYLLENNKNLPNGSAWKILANIKIDTGLLQSIYDNTEIP